MPDGAILSPDLSWIRRDRWEALTTNQRASYAPIVPDVCIELVSPSDRIEATIATPSFSIRIRKPCGPTARRPTCFRATSQP